jgi:hypothetical protein
MCLAVFVEDGVAQAVALTDGHMVHLDYRVIDGFDGGQVEAEPALNRDGGADGGKEGMMVCGSDGSGTACCHLSELGWVTAIHWRASR